MKATITPCVPPYDVAALLRTPEQVADYLDAWLDKVPDDAVGIA